MIRLDPPPTPWHRRVHRWVARRRRLVAVVLVLLATWSAGSAAMSTLRPATVPVVVATRELPSGTRLAPGDVRTVDWPADLAPDGVVETVEGVVLASSLLRGEALTRARVRDDPSAGLGTAVEGRVAVLAGLADAWTSTLVAPGTVVDVYVPAAWDGHGAAGASATRVAVGAVVLDTVGPASGGGPGLGLAGPGDDAGPGEPPATALVLAVRPREASGLAAAAGTGVAVTVPLPEDAAGSAVPDRGRVG